MSRDYGRVYTSFWNSKDIRCLSMHGKLLANYLITGPHSNMVGAYLLPDAYIADDLDWPIKTVRETLSELFKNGFATRFKDGRHIAIPKYLQWNPIENPNVGKAALKIVDQLPDDPALEHVLKGLMLYEKQFPNGLETLSKRLGKPFRNPEPVPEPDPEPDQEPEQEKGGASAEADLPDSEPFIALDTNVRGEKFIVSTAAVEKYRQLYPAVDIDQALRGMSGWLLANPKKRKTKHGMAQFINSWLARDQDKGGSSSGNKSGYGGGSEKLTGMEAVLAGARAALVGNA